MTERGPQTPVMPPQAPMHPVEGTVEGGPRYMHSLDDLEALLAESQPAQVSVVPAAEVVPAHTVAVSAPESAPVSVPVAVGGRHSAPEDANTYGRHAAIEGITPSERSVDGIKARLANESAPSLPAVGPRTPEARPGFADRSREAARRTGGNIFRRAVNKSKDLRDYIKAGIKAEGTQVIGFKDIARAAKDSAGAAKTKIGERYEQGKQRQREEWQSVREGFVTAGRTARFAKGVWVESLKKDAEKDREKVMQVAKVAKGAGLVAVGSVILGAGAAYKGARVAGEATARGARAAGKGLAYGGNVVAQVGYEAGAASARGAKAAGRATKHGAVKSYEVTKQGAQATAEAARKAGKLGKEVVALAGDEIVDLRAGNAEFRAQRSDPEYKAQKQAAKHEAKSKKAEALRARAAAREDRRAA
jgi:hypothetical protein